MNAAILTIGDEILIGKIINTNSSHISKMLNTAGIKTVCHMTMPDEEQPIVEALDMLREKADVIICTGGLGVTDDDISKQVITRYFNRRLIISDQSKNDVISWYEARKLPMPPIAAGFMELPSESRYLKNTVGIAPGAIIEDGDLIMVLLPGPPKEMKPMFDIALGYIQSLNKSRYETLYIKTFGIREADLFLKLKDLISRYNRTVQITTYCENLEVTIAVRYSSKVSKMSVDNIIYEIYSRLGDSIYADSNMTLEEVLCSYLDVRNVKLAVAESITGGEICSRIIRQAGVSRHMYEGIVCYDNDSKIDRLGVSAKTLQEKGAVSEDTAYEMAAGLLEKTSADIVIATTGIAGPDGGSEEKPVGLVYIAIGTKDAIHIYKQQFYGDRAEIRDCAVKTALYEAIKVLK